MAAAAAAGKSTLVLIGLFGLMAVASAQMMDMTKCTDSWRHGARKYLVKHLVLCNLREIKSKIY